jgi:hypothetical protein
VTDNTRKDGSRAAAEGADGAQAADTVKLDAVALRKLVVSTVLQVEDDADGEDASDDTDSGSDDVVAAPVGARRL